MAVILGSLAGCTDGRDVVEVGQLGFSDEQPMIEIPSTGNVGAPVSLRVTTTGDGCVTFESTDVAMTEHGAHITPYDRRRIPGENEGCQLLLKHIPHDVSLVFQAAGRSTVVVHGRRSRNGAMQEIELPFEIEIQ